MEAKTMNNKPQEKKLRKLVLTVLFGCSVILWLISSVLAYMALAQPAQIQKTVYENTITQQTSFDFKAEIAPSLLYPSGGRITPDQLIMASITKGLQVQISTIITARQPINVQGTQKVVLQVIAQDLWKREYVISDSKEFKYDSVKAPIIQNTFYVELATQFKYIESVLKEVQVAPEKYIFKIKPVIEGSILCNNKTFPLDPSAELNFIYRSNVLKMDGEKEYKKELPVKEVTSLKQDFLLNGYAIPLGQARLCFSLASLLMLCVNILVLLRTGKLKISRTIQTEQEQIDKKYRSRLISVEGLYRFSQSDIPLISFKALLQVADDRELPIFRVQDKQGNTLYYITDSAGTYSYYPRKSPDMGVDNINIEGGESYVQKDPQTV